MKVNENPVPLPQFPTEFHEPQWSTDQPIHEQQRQINEAARNLTPYLQYGITIAKHAIGYNSLSARLIQTFLTNARKEL